jgi:hypothetical protein
MVDQVWGKHATVVTGSQGSEQVSKNEWNENLNRKGLLGFDSETVASASDITIPDDTSDDVSSFIKLSGSTSVDKFIITNTSDGDLLYLITTGSVTLNNVSSPSVAGQIRLLGDAAKDLSTTVPTTLIRVGDYWYEYGLSGVILTPSILTSSLTTVGTIGTGTWQGTAVGDTYISSASTWNAKQNALTFGIADGNAVDIDGSGTATGEYAKFTANGIVGEEVADVKTDLSLNNVENTALSTWAGTTNLTTLGTIATGTWNATAPTTAYGGTGLTSFTAGDIVYYASGTTLTKLAKPVTPAGEVLTFATSASAPSWVAAGGGATLTDNSINGVTDGQTTTATSWTNMTGTSSATLATITGGKAYCTMYCNSENNTTNSVNYCSIWDGTSSIIQGLHRRENSAGAYHTDTFAIVHALDGTTLQMRMQVNQGTMGIFNSASVGTKTAILEIS